MRSLSLGDKLPKLAIIGIVLLLAACKPGSDITCLTPREHSKPFWQETARELEAIRATSPHVMQLIKEWKLDQDAILQCVKKRAKKK